MHRYRNIFLAVCLSFTMLFAVGCKNTPSAPSAPVKPVTGIDPVFVEPLGYNNESASVIEENGTRYLYYTRNAETDKSGDTIAVRKGTKAGDAWVYGDYTTVLRPSESGWDDRNVFAPSVVKGTFGYKNSTYSYLMAYAASGVSRRESCQIGLAVSNAPDSGFVRVLDPIVTYNKLDFSSEGQLNAVGATEPSLISFDKAGKVFLFYTLFAPNISATARFLELDLSVIDSVSPVRATFGSMVSARGAEDATADSSLLNADYAYAPGSGEYGTLYAVKDKYPTETQRPALSAAVTLYVGGEYEALYEVISGKPEMENAPDVWTQMGDINFRKTAVFDDPKRTDGYSRIFSAAIVTDAYGWMLGDAQAEIVFTASPTADVEGFAYAKSLHATTLPLY